LTIGKKAFTYRHTYCLSASKCLSCGKCDSTKSIKNIITAQPEHGKDHFNLITSEHKDLIPNQRLLICVEVDSGPVAAMSSEFLKVVILRAFLKAAKAEADVIKAVIAEKSFNNSRRGYRIKKEGFKSILAGKFIQEIMFSKNFILTKPFIDEVMKDINKHTTRGWKVVDMKIKPGEYILKNKLKYTLTSYRFDSRKVKSINESYLKDKVVDFLDKNKILKYKAQKAENRSTVRIEMVDFDKSKIKNISIGMGRNQYECVAKFLMEVEEAHPLILISGFLGKNDKPLSYNMITGTDIIVENFLTDFEDGTNLFDGSAVSNTCPKCGGMKMIDLVTEKPFYNSDSILDKRYPEGLCQNCWMELTN